MRRVAPRLGRLARRSKGQQGRSREPTGLERTPEIRDRTEVLMRKPDPGQYIQAGCLLPYSGMLRSRR
jgi:hypothetical protein